MRLRPDPRDRRRLDVHNDRSCALPDEAEPNQPLECVGELARRTPQGP